MYDVHVQRKTRGVLGMLLQEIRCSEINSEAIFGQKQSCSTYMVHSVLQSSFGCHV